MTDLYLSNRTHAEQYHQKLLHQLNNLIRPDKLPGCRDPDLQTFYLEFKKRIVNFVADETKKQKKKLLHTDNSHLLLLERTSLIDAVVQTSFRTALWLANRDLETPLEEDSLPLALVARGGYGRQEMYYSSDVDIHIIQKTSASEKEINQTDQVIHYFDYLLVYQDIFPTTTGTGPSQLNTEDEEYNQTRLSIFYSLMEHRMVAGNPWVYSEFKGSIKAASLVHKEQILKECFKHKTYFEIQNTVFQQEPNIKEELKRLYWATSMVRIRESHEKINQFELLSELYNKQKLSTLAFKNMQNGLNFLSRVRLILHCHQTGAHRDVLSYEVREVVAEAMGFKNQVREFFREYYFQAALPMKRYCRNLFWESITFTTRPSKKLSGEFGLNSENQIIFCEGHENHSWDPPTAVFDIFLWVARKNYFLSYPVIRSIELNLDRMTPLFQNSAEKAQVQIYFQNFIRGKYFAKTIRYLHEFKLLEQYFIPEFKNLSGLLQDIFVHMFPTDIHVLAALDELNKLEIASEADPFLVELYQSLRDRTTLKLSVILHDIGKGIKTKGENEELVGAHAVPLILENLGYVKNQKLIKDVAFLVEKHLMMKDLMLLDPDEDDTYDMIWDLVNKDVDRLKMLILLTYADRAGTKMRMSKSQIDQLKYFYQNTLHHKKKVTVPKPVQHEFISMIRLPKDLQSQLQTYNEFKKSKDGFVAEMFFKQERPSQLVVCSRDHQGLLFKISAVLAFNKLSIVEANIHTLGKNVLDVFKVCDISGNPVEFSNFFFVQKQILEDLNKIFIENIPVSSLYQGRPLTTGIEEGKYRDIKLKISLIGNAVKVETHDIIGTVMMETKVFSELNMEIQRSVIHTNYGTASNIFYVRPEDVRQIMREEQKFKKLLAKTLAPLVHPEPIFPDRPVP